MIQSELERYEENVFDYFKVKRAKKRVSEDAQQVGTNFIGLSLNFDFEHVFLLYCFPIVLCSNFPDIAIVFTHEM